MILGNEALLDGLRQGWFRVDGPGINWATARPDEPPFNTSALDLHLGEIVQEPRQGAPVAIDLSEKRHVATFLAEQCDSHTLTPKQPYLLRPRTFVLAATRERVAFPYRISKSLSMPGVTTFAGRVEGKSSLARFGLLVHFTAPTIHAGFEGTITLEMINLGPWSINLTPGMPICQLIIEAVMGSVSNAPNQFKGQSTPAGR